MTTHETITTSARALSWALHPIILPLYLLLTLFSQTAFVHFSPFAKWFLCGIVVLYGIVAPILAILALRYIGRISNLRIAHRRERTLLLLICATCYLIASLTICRIEAADFLRKILLAAALLEALCAWITVYWKISLHLAAMGLAVAMMIILNLLGLPQMLAPMLATIVAAGLLASARLYLHRHTATQVACGFGLGLAVGIVSLLFC